MPLLLALARGNEHERGVVRHAIEHGEVARLDEVVAIVRRTGALEAARALARDESTLARERLCVLPASPEREALLDLCARSVDRSS